MNVTSLGQQDLTFDSGLEVTVNGDQTYGRFQAPVFKFVQYTAVWLHCDLQICIRDTCQPTCDANGRRRKRRAGHGGYGPQDWEERTVGF